MIDIKAFIRDLGKEAPAYFGASESTVQRWLKTGNVPIKQAQKIFAANEAVMKAAVREAGQQSGQQQQPIPAAFIPPTSGDPAIDPMTKLPVNLDRKLPNVAGFAGKPPDEIEINPTEQSFGLNMTRPGRINQGPMAPMKLKDVDGQKVAFRENTPALADQKNPDGTPRITLPPSISNETGGFAAKPNEPETAAPESIS